jgi:hypothetical protein
MDTGETTDSLREVPVGARIVLSPERETEAVIAIEATAIAVVPSARKHEAPKLELGLLQSIGGSFEGRVFDAFVLAEGLLKGVEASEKGQRASDHPRRVSNIDTHGLALRISPGCGTVL